MSAVSVNTSEDDDSLAVNGFPVLVVCDDIAAILAFFDYHVPTCVDGAVCPSGW
jgi:hypothetical protein